MTRGRLTTKRSNKTSRDSQVPRSRPQAANQLSTKNDASRQGQGELQAVQTIEGPQGSQAQLRVDLSQVVAIEGKALLEVEDIIRCCDLRFGHANHHT